jgi:hypothetical protein
MPGWGAVSTAFIDPEGYKHYVAEREQAFRAELAREQPASVGERLGVENKSQWAPIRNVIKIKIKDFQITSSRGRGNRSRIQSH